MALSKPIARTLDSSARILGLHPLEIAGSASLYAMLSVVLRGVPFSALIALGATAGATLVIRVVNLTRPPEHAIHWLMHQIRPGVFPVVPFEPAATRFRGHL